MKTSEVMQAWGRILQGKMVPRFPIEIAFQIAFCGVRACYWPGGDEPDHLGGGATLRSLQDFKGAGSCDRSTGTGGSASPIASVPCGRRSFSEIPRTRSADSSVAQARHSRATGNQARVPPSTRAAWADMPNLNVVVSIDGLAPEHDVRRAPCDL